MGGRLLRLRSARCCCRCCCCCCGCICNCSSSIARVRRRLRPLICLRRSESFDLVESRGEPHGEGKAVIVLLRRFVANLHLIVFDHDDNGLQPLLLELRHKVARRAAHRRRVGFGQRAVHGHADCFAHAETRAPRGAAVWYRLRSRSHHGTRRRESRSQGRSECVGVAGVRNEAR